MLPRSCTYMYNLFCSSWLWSIGIAKIGFLQTHKVHGFIHIFWDNNYLYNYTLVLNTCTYYLHFTVERYFMFSPAMSTVSFRQTPLCLQNIAHNRLITLRELVSKNARQGPQIDTGSVLGPGRQKLVQFPKTSKCRFCFSNVQRSTDVTTIKQFEW